MPSVTVFRRFFGGQDAGAWSRTFDVVEVEEAVLETEVTDNPVETGVVIADHAFDRPVRLTITAAVSDLPPPGKDQDAFAVVGTSRSMAAYAWLNQARRAHEPFSVQTGLDLYSSMLITSLRTKQDKDTSRVLKFTVELREIVYVSTQTVIYPATQAKTKRAVAPKKNDGEKESAELTDADKKKAKKSFLKMGLDMLGVSTTQGQVIGP
jgi:hypothetical protein